MVKRRLVFLGMMLSVGFAVWHWPAAEAHTRITTDVTWAEHIRPIMEAKCMSCHHPGGLAPDYVDLTFYGTDTEPGAWAWRAYVEEAVILGKMPPWKPDPRFGDFDESHLLTQMEKDLIIAWTRGGGPQGTPFNLPPPEKFKNLDWMYGQPDLAYELPEDRVIKPDQMTDSLTVTFPVDIEEDQWITGYEFLPHNPKVIDRMTVFIHDPKDAEPEVIEIEKQVEYDSLATDEELEQTRMRETPAGPHFLGQWVRGDWVAADQPDLWGIKPVLLPEAAGRKLRKGSTIELQIEYRRPDYSDTSIEIHDRSKFGIFLSGPDEEVDILVESKPLDAGEFTLAANEADKEVRAAITMDESVHLLGVHPHLGVLGKNVEVKATYPDGREKTLVLIPEFSSKWTQSYTFAEPIAAPEGTKLEVIAHYDNSEENWENPYQPPVNLKAGDELTDLQLFAWVDYALDDHLIIPRPFVPIEDDPSRGRGGMSVGGLTPFDNLPIGADSSTPPTDMPEPAQTDAVASVAAEEDEEIWWCPMRGSPCEMKDYHAPGTCDDCFMDLKPKASFFVDRPIAPLETEWVLTETGRAPIYWCPNRGQEGHELIDYTRPGTCEECGTPLMHKAQFEPRNTWTCLTPTCKQHKVLFYGPGICPDCGQPVAGMGHMDHTPLHNGEFFMADNLYHHLEGTLTEPGKFKLYFYDDWKVPLDPRNFSGTAFIETENPKTGDVVETKYPLEIAREGDMWMSVELPTDVPIILYAKVMLAGEEKRFDFQFDQLTVEPVGPVRGGPVRLHSHERPTLVIPDNPQDILKEIQKRDLLIQGLIDKKDWFALQYPALDTKDYVTALLGMQDGLNPRERGTLKKALTSVNLGADALHNAGDSLDEARVKRGYANYAEGIAMLESVFATQ